MVKIISDWGVSTLAYFLIGFAIAYGIRFWMGADQLVDLATGKVIPGAHRFDLLHCFFLTTFAACIPAIISGHIAERAKVWPQVFGGGACLGYPLFEAVIWGWGAFFQTWLTQTFCVAFHDYAGSVVVHSIGGWVALPAVIILGQRIGRR